MHCSLNDIKYQSRKDIRTFLSSILAAPLSFQFILTEIRFQQLASAAVSQTTDRFFLDLANALTGKIEFSSDLFECKSVLAADSEEQLDHITLTLCQCCESTFDLFLQRLVHKQTVGTRRIVVHD